MRCRIADLIVEIPEAGGLAPRCQAYLTEETSDADIVLRTEDYLQEPWKNRPYELMCYMESCAVFYSRLLRFDGMMLHASAITLNGKVFLFSGPSTVGKSTHTRLWKQLFGDAACIINDDKPALRFIEGCWYAYGTPWCGKDGINENRKAVLAGICFLKQGSENRIRRLAPVEAIPLLLSQTIYKISKPETMDLLIAAIDKLVRAIPIFELENLPNEDAARLSSATMLAAAEE